LCYASRVFIGLGLDGTEILVLKTSVISDLTKGNDAVDAGLGVMVFVCMTIIGILGGLVIQPRISKESLQRRKNIFYLAFKTINVVFAVFISIGTIYGRDQLDFNRWEHIFLVVSLGLDVLFGPFEMILGYYQCCRN
jgi:hypothetical protein